MIKKERLIFSTFAALSAEKVQEFHCTLGEHAVTKVRGGARVQSLYVTYAKINKACENDSNVCSTSDGALRNQQQCAKI